MKPPGAIRLLSNAVWDSVLRLDSTTPIDSENFRAFRYGREHVFTLTAKTGGKHDLIVDVETLGMYSCFFYGDRSVRSGLQHLLGKVRPKAPYQNFANRIASSLSPFNSIHIRRGDFRYVGQSPRADQVTGQELVRNLASRLSRDDLLVICTDTSGERRWFAPLLSYFRNVVFLDHLILRSDRWRAEFQKLPYHDDTVLGLVTQLVAARAECFLGTLFSSFTAIIQRLRGFAGKPDFLFCYSDWDPKLVRFERCEYLPVQDGPYSWNRVLYPVYPNVLSWFREWPEAYQPSLVSNGDRELDNIVVLRAAHAVVHGRKARYERTDDWNDNIGYWTDSRDYVFWNFSIVHRLLYQIEARYACPDGCAGSRYTIEVGNKVVFDGRVAATGDWALFSSWQRLGKISLVPGRHRLTVRIVEMTGYAALNLAGIRLVPVCD
jgi:hypothetical protein